MILGAIYFSSSNSVALISGHVQTTTVLPSVDIDSSIVPIDTFLIKQGIVNSPVLMAH